MTQVMSNLPLGWTGEWALGQSGGHTSGQAGWKAGGRMSHGARSCWQGANKRVSARAVGQEGKGRLAGSRALATLPQGVTIGRLHLAVRRKLYGLALI